nr:helix-turn-helix transcriptional regulator [Agrobacterium larrymoorei]
MRVMKHPAIHEVSLEQLFYALSDPVRLEIVQKLCITDEATCSALDGGRPKSSVSHHFRVLREAGLVWTRNEGVTHMNALRRAELNERFPGLLDVVEAAMRNAPKQHHSDVQTAKQ